MEAFLTEFTAKPVVPIVPKVNEETKQKQTKYAQDWQKGMDNILLEFEKAQDILKEVLTKDDDSIKQKFLQSEKFSLYWKAVCEMYRVACRLRNAVEHYGEYLSAASSPMATLFLVDKIERIWNELCTSVGNKPVEFESRSTWNMEKNCKYCLIPLDAHDTSLTHQSSHYHSSCANFWVHYNGKLE